MKSLEVLDGIRLHFSSGGVLFMNITLAFIMFGVALEIDVRNFRTVFLKPRPILVGLIAQYFLLPLITFFLVLIIHPTPSIALGMILVAACPSGNIANFLTLIAKGNIELSVTLNAIATLLAVFLTPLNFALYGHLYSHASHLVIPITIDAWQMLRTVFFLLGLPLLAGTVFNWYLPKIAISIRKPVKIASVVVFVGFIIAALQANFDYFLKYIQLIVLIVFIHNALVMSSGFLLARLSRLEWPNIKTITIESGIHNSGLALVLIFNPRLFNGLGGMAFIAAWWGIWHLIAGMIVATLFSKRTSIKMI